MKFSDFNLPSALLESISSNKFETPTPIQLKTIPEALEGKDIFGTAQTGTGKTLAYAIPLIAHLINSPQSAALVLAPTRELAMQVLHEIKKLAGNIPMNSALLIGGDSMEKQLSQLAKKPRFFVGTPGRINDHLMRKSLKLDKVDFVVFDETDRMLDMGFSIQLEKIAHYLPDQRQMLMFSATITPTIVAISKTYMLDEVRVSVGSTTNPTEKIKQEIIRVTEAEKYETLLNHLQRSNGSVVIFVKTKFATERLAKRLYEDSHKAKAIHGDLRQRQRESVITSFRNSKNRILVATDVAARGLDIPHIEYVINYDLPQCPEDYIHRIGRTGRAGAEGIAISFISPQDETKWRIIYQMMNPKEKYKSSDTKPSHSGRKFGDRKGSFANKNFRDKPRKSFAKNDQEFGSHSNERKNSFTNRTFRDKPINSFAKNDQEFGGNSNERKNSFANKNFKDKPHKSFAKNDQGFEGKKPFFKEKSTSPSQTHARRSEGKKPFFKEKSTSSSQTHSRRSEGNKPTFGKPKMVNQGRKKPRFADL